MPEEITIVDEPVDEVTSKKEMIEMLNKTPKEKLGEQYSYMIDVTRKDLKKAVEEAKTLDDLKKYLIGYFGLDKKDIA